MELGELKTFVTVVAERSFSLAAIRLCRTQPAVSQAIRRLEEDLGERLFDRSAKQPTLTQAGDALLPEAIRRRRLCGDHRPHQGHDHSRGENLSPREIEEFLHTHEKVSDVQVIGVPDHKYGEEVCAWILLDDGVTATADEFRDFCRGQIATFKIPRYIRFTGDFPMTVTGKVQKFRMREITVAELALARVTNVEPTLRVVLRGDNGADTSDKIIRAHTGGDPVRQSYCVCAARMREPGKPEPALHAHRLGDERAGRRRTGVQPSGCAAGESWHSTHPLRRSRRDTSEPRF
jgi:hypothetical protein